MQPQQQPQQQMPAPQAAPPPVLEEEEHPAPNSIFAEGLGAGLWYSINYERLVIDQLGVRIGVGVVPLSASASGGGSTASSTAVYVPVPIEVNYVGLRGGSHVFEMGGGATLTFWSGEASSGGLTSSASAVSVVGQVHLGWRIQPVGGGFMFRMGLMALIGEGLDVTNLGSAGIGVLPWGYLSLGASF
jgi:hypothetical protein